MVNRFKSLIPGRSGRVRLAGVMGLALAMAGCSSGSSEQAITPPSASMVNGAVTKGSTVAARIRIFAFDFSGQPVGAALAETQSDTNGNFQVPGLNPNRAYLVQACGGAFKDESDESGLRIVTLSLNDCLESILPAGASSVAVTPYTQALVNKLRREAVNNSFASLLNSGRAIFAEAIGFDVLINLPTDPVAPSGTPQQIAYDMALGGAAATMNRMAILSGLPAFDFATVLAFAEDLADGRLDGVAGGSPILINGRALEDLDVNILIRLFRNNNFYAGYQRAPLVQIDEDILSRPAVPEQTNQPPTAVDDVFSGTEGQALVVPPPGVLLNDSDVDGLSLSASLVDGPAVGELSFQETGGFRYLPPEGSGEISVQFTYQISNGRQNSDPATVTINLTRQPRISVPATREISEGNSGISLLTVPLRLSFASSRDVTVRYATQDDNALAGSDYNAASGTVTIPAGALEGSITLEILGDTDIEADERFGLLLFEPQNALIDQGVSIITIINDDRAPEPTPTPTPVATPTPTPVPTGPPTPPPNLNPVANNDSVTVNEDAPPTLINVRLNDSDPDGGTITVTGVTAGSQGGSTSVVSNQVQYQPAPNYNGSETFGYMISDGQGGSASAIVSVTVNPVNDPPTVLGSLTKTVSINASPPPAIAPGELAASDVDMPAPSSLVFSVTAAPACGGFTLSGAPTTSFTQQDIINSLVAFDPFDCIGGDTASAGLSLSDGIAAPVSASFNVTVAASCAIPPDGLVAWFSGDAVHTNAGAMLAYDIEQGNHGSWTVEADSGVAAGQVAEAMRFLATDGVIKVPDSAAYVTNAFTVDAWINITALPGAGQSAPILRSLHFGHTYGLSVTDTGALSGFTVGGDGSASALSPPGSIIAGRWTHVAMSYVDSFDSGGMQLYIDGAPVFPTPLTPQASYFSSPSAMGLDIGGDSLSAGAPSFNGLIDELQLINRVMSDAEIHGIYRAGRVGKCKPMATDDPDGDGLPFSGEMMAGSNPRNPDTDGDGLSDGDEVNNPTFPSDPTKVDTDGDDLPDGDEIAGGTDPADPLDPGPGGKIYVSNLGADTNDGSSWATAERTSAGILGNPAYATLSDTSALFIILEEFHTIDGLLLDASVSSRNPIIILGSQQNPTPPPLAKAASGPVNSRIDANFDPGPMTDPTDCGALAPAFNNASLIVRGIPQVSLSRLIIQDGQNACSSGGGVSIVDSNVMMDQVKILRNRATLAGGTAVGGGVGIVSSGAPLTLSIKNAQIDSNFVMDGSGGGVGAGPNISVQMDNVLILSNLAGRAGGGVWAGCPVDPSSCNLQVLRSEVRSNVADSGSGGIGVQDINQLRIEDSVIANNRIRGGSAGGIRLRGKIFNAKVRHNRVLGNGLIYELNTSTGDLQRVGSSGGGGGIEVFIGPIDASGSSIDISNNLVVGNAAEFGGGIYAAGLNTAPLDSLIIAYNTIAFNRGHSGHGGLVLANNVSATVLEVANNIIRYNESADPSTHGEADDNISDVDNVMTRVLNNIEVTLAGSDFDSDPRFVQDFYLDQGTPGPGQSVGGGDPGYNGLLSLGIDMRTTDAPLGNPDPEADDLGYHHDRPGAGLPGSLLNFRNPCGGLRGSAGNGGTLPLPRPGCQTVTEFKVEPLFGGRPEPGHRVAAYVLTFDVDSLGSPLACTGVSPEPSCPEVLVGPQVFAVDSDPNGRLLRDNGDGSYSLRLKWRYNAGDAVLRFLVDGQSYDIAISSAAYSYCPGPYGSSYSYTPKPYYSQLEDTLPSSSACYYGSGY